MKACKSFKPRHLCLGIAVTSTLALSIGLQAAPRTGEHGNAGVTSRASRHVTGPSASMNQALASGATAVIALHPRPPMTQPPSSYPAGTSIDNQTLTLGSVPARLWIEVLVTGWAPETLNTTQITISATDADMDGGGYAGGVADCAGNPVAAGDLAPAMQPCVAVCENRPGIQCTTSSECRLCDGGDNDGLACTSNEDCPGGTCPASSAAGCSTNHSCRHAFTGRLTDCTSGDPSRCENWTGVSPGSYFPAGMFCQPGFIDQCDSEFIGTGMGNISLVDISTLDYRFGTTTLNGFGEELLDFGPGYAGTLVIDAPADARGTYTIDIDEPETFLENPSFPPGNNIPILAFHSAVIEIPCALMADSSGLSKTRFISFSVPGDITAPAALRVTLVSLHHVEPPYTGGASVPFTSFEGQVRWVGPPAEYVESTATGTPFFVSSLQCTPHYQDWSTVGLLHVTGSAITPSSVYEVEYVNQSCMGNEAGCTEVSAPLEIVTTRWGDVDVPYNPPDATAQPNFADVTAMVSKFRNIPGAPIKARVLIVGNDANGNIHPDALSSDFSFSHIAACVDAFRGSPYPFTIQSCP